MVACVVFSSFSRRPFDFGARLALRFGSNGQLGTGTLSDSFVPLRVLVPAHEVLTYARCTWNATRCFVS